jgi:hypothetical protein
MRSASDRRGRGPDILRRAPTGRINSAQSRGCLIIGRGAQPGKSDAEQTEFAPDYWRKRAAETRGLAELIEDQLTAETLLEIALRYDELALRAE